MPLDSDWIDGDSTAADRHFAARRNKQSENHSQRRCLTGAIGPEKAVDLSVIGVKRHIIDRQNVACSASKLFGEMLNTNHVQPPIKNSVLFFGTLRMSLTRLIECTVTQPIFDNTPGISHRTGCEKYTRLNADSFCP